MVHGPSPESFRIHTEISALYEEPGQVQPNCRETFLVHKVLTTSWTGPWVMGPESKKWAGSDFNGYPSFREHVRASGSKRLAELEPPSNFLLKLKKDFFE